jgi:flavin-dependent dehydrogenase
VRLGYRRRFTRTTREPVALMTQRRRLDHFLFEQAARAGADARDGVTVRDVRADGLTVDGEEIRARIVLGADGCNGLAARSLGLAAGVAHGVALEANLPYGGAVSRERFGRTMVLEIAVVPGGYAWVFPKGDHVNVGVGGDESEGPNLRAHLRRLCDEHGLDPDELTEIRGHRLPMRRPESTLARGAAAVIGDAAGLVDPFSGDGMYEAFLSAQLVAEAILAGDLASYPAAVERRIAPLTRAGWGARAAFDRFPRTTYALARLPITFKAVEKLLRGDLTHPGAARGLERGAVKLIYTVAKAAAH